MFNDKIEIDVEDKVLFGQIALVVDKPRVLEALKKIRSRFKIESPLSSSEDHVKFLRNLGEKGIDGKFHKSINAIIRRYNLDPFYYRVLQKALLFNKIKAADYVDAYIAPAEIINNDYIKQYIIVISPNTSKHSLLRVFDEFKSSIKVSRKSGGYRKHYYLNDLTRDSNVVRTEIKRDRDWYWAHKMGSSYKTLAKLEKNTPQNTVVQAIKRYRKSLDNN